ncbi:MAG: molybdate ABC transporter substrate-binding protein [Planctomycetota bacterium]
MLDRGAGPAVVAEPRSRSAALAVVRRLLSHTALAAALLGGASCGSGGQGGDGSTAVVRVAVAANFARTAQELERAFEEGRPDVDVRLSVGSTGALYAQVVNGAPYDVLLAADAERLRRLLDEGRAVEVRRYAQGRLALVGRALDGVEVDASDSGALARLLASDAVEHLAIANPETAPYGVAALEVLDRLGVADELGPRRVRGTDVGQTYQFAESGAAELAIVALSQALADPTRPHLEIPSELFEPIGQDAALVGRGDTARSFFDFVTGPEVRAIVERAGYGAPRGD